MDKSTKQPPKKRSEMKIGNKTLGVSVSSNSKLNSTDLKQLLVAYTKIFAKISSFYSETKGKGLLSSNMFDSVQERYMPDQVTPKVSAFMREILIGFNSNHETEEIKRIVSNPERLINEIIKIVKREEI